MTEQSLKTIGGSSVDLECKQVLKQGGKNLKNKMADTISFSKVTPPPPLPILKQNRKPELDMINGFAVTTCYGVDKC